MIKIYFLLVLCFYCNNFAMHQLDKKYNQEATRKFIEIIETRNETVAGSDFDANETVSCIRRLIKKGANPNILNSSGRNVLWLAIFLRDKFLLQSLLARGINVNQANKIGETPLVFAILLRAVEFLKPLINAGANVNYQSRVSFGVCKTPLMRALEFVGGVKWQMMSILLRSDADVFLKDKSGYTILHYAVCQNDPDVVHYLLDQNNCVSLLTHAACENGFTPFSIALQCYPQIFPILQKRTQKLR